MKEYPGGDLRCDLHPRWSRTGDAICFDALETSGWTRQLHVAARVWKGQRGIASGRPPSIVSMPPVV